MKIIGISGGTGAGKSTVCAELEKRGACVIDADKISRQVSEPDGAAFGEIVESFGEKIVDAFGRIDRKALGRIVFSNPDKLALLNSITHKHIFAEMQKKIDECTADIAVLDVPLLFQDNFPFRCHLTVAVIAKPEVRLERIMARDGIGLDAATARMKNQMSDAEYARLADICVENNGGKDVAGEIADRIIMEVKNRD